MLYVRNATCRRNSTWRAHHHHLPGSAGAQCVNCHMPMKNYMVVDARRDHSIRVPRPDLSVSLGTPNACTQCHADRPGQWAAETVAGWYPGGRQTIPHYGTALHAGRVGAADAEQQLDRLILDQQPAGDRAGERLATAGALYNACLGTGD